MLGFPLGDGDAELRRSARPRFLGLDAEGDVVATREFAVTDLLTGSLQPPLSSRSGAIWRVTVSTDDVARAGRCTGTGPSLTRDVGLRPRRACGKDGPTETSRRVDDDGACMRSWPLLALGMLSSGAMGAAGKGNPMVVISTSMGDIKIELYADKAPVTVKNFLDYAKASYYDGTIFHRVIPGFMIQGGGFDRRHEGQARRTEAADQERVEQRPEERHRARSRWRARRRPTAPRRSSSST